MAGISRFGTVCSIFIWLGVIFGFGFFSEYNYDTASGDYSMWQDVHVMVFIGFGFLMSFMAKNSFTAVGHAMIAAAFAVVLSFFNYWVWHNIINHPRDEESWFRFRIGVDQLVNADFCAASILISFGAVIGRVSLMQLMTMTLFEVVFYSINEAIGYGRFGVADIGGSMIIHTFGAYFGLALSLVLDKKETRKKRNEEKAAPDVTPVSDTMAMAGVLFLWCFWPSFNGYFGDAADPTKTGMRQRAVVNTYLSLCASTVATYIVSSLIGKGRVSMVDVQNATLAGGVAMGTAANMLCMPYGALIIGTFAGTVSTLGFNYITPFLDRTIGLKDTCGVHNLHGMPGVIGAIAGIILSANAAKDNYSSTGYSWTNVWPNADSKNLTYKSLLGYQIATLFVTIGIAIFGGIVTGVLLRLFKTLPSFYDDHHEYFVHGDTAAIDAAKEMQAVEPIAA